MRIVIVEDEPLIQQRIKRLTLDILSEHQPTIVCFGDIDDADEYLRENTIDLLLLDLNLMGRDGFELLKANVAGAYHTIVISAYAEKAVIAFEYGVLDFIAKPFDRDRLEKAFNRLLTRSQENYYGCRYLSVKKQGSIELVAISDVSYIQAEGHYSLLNICMNEASLESRMGAKTYLHSKNIEKIMQLLPECFLRVHRSYIVNMNYVKKLNIKEGSRYFLQIDSNMEIPVGRTKVKEVKEHFDRN
jgi:two-component system response regulator LytT